MRKLFLSFFALLLASQLIYAQTPEQQKIRFETFASEALKLRQFQVAAQYFEEALKVAPESWYNHYNAAMVYDSIGTAASYRKAIEHYYKFMEKNSSHERNQVIQRRIYSLEFLMERSVSQEETLQHLLGTWHSNQLNRSGFHNFPD